MFFKKKKKALIAATEDENEELFYESRKTVRELIAPNGVNPNHLDYLIIHDNGIDLYTVCMYINSLPKRAVFATTFAPLFNSAGVTSTVFIEPMLDGKASKQLDKRIIILDSERLEAENAGDRNRHRKISTKISDAERVAEDVESGDNGLFEVAFLFVLQAVTYDKLQMFVNDFHSVAREKGIELAACYGVHPEAFLSGYTTNRIYKATYGIAKSSVIKKHIFDKGALTTIFNHTRSTFFHRNGVILGHNLYTNQPVTYDPYDDSHESYSLVIVGKTGSGKSATIKMLQGRLVDFDYFMCSIDFEPRGTQGEYALLAKEAGGVSFLISPKSKHILNMFDIGTEEEYDESTGKEYVTLHLSEKIVNVVYLIMILIKNGKKIEKFEHETSINRIVTDIVSELYNELGIYDGEVDSLYEVTNNSLEDGRLTSGKRKKISPVFTDFYKKVLIRKATNTNELYQMPYQIIVDSLKDYVRELYYCPECNRFFTREEFNKQHTCPDCQCNIVAINGTKPYFDGQSTISTSLDTPYINFDISQLVDSEKLNALLICMSIIQENYIKKNSINVKKARKMITLVDEVTKALIHEEARLFVENWYRTGRKRHVSTWTAAQSLADFKGTKETEAIIKNANTIMIFKQESLDRDFIKKATTLTDSQIDQIITLGGTDEEEIVEIGGGYDEAEEEEKNKRRGEMCMIDNGKVVFVKVDYLTESEARYVETDMMKIEKMYKRGGM